MSCDFHSLDPQADRPIKCDACKAEGAAEAIARVVAMMRGDARRFMGTRHHAASGHGRLEAVSIYKRSEASIEKEMGRGLPEDSRREIRLRIDFESLLIGPTSAHRANDLAEKRFDSATHREVALAMRSAAMRYLTDLKRCPLCEAEDWPVEKCEDAT